MNELKERDKKHPSILFILTDEGDQGAPTNRKFQVYQLYLMMKYDFDSVVIASYGPYMSRYNPVERAMSVLNRPLAGMNNILDGMSGSSQRLKTRNALRSLCNAFNKVRYNELVKCEYVSPGSNENVHRSDVINFPHFSEFWKYFEAISSTHQVARIEQLLCSIHKHTIAGSGAHCCQMVKCNDATCCSPKRSTGYFNYLEGTFGFIPAPIPSQVFDDGQIIYTAMESQVTEKNSSIIDICPFDAHLPSKACRTINRCTTCNRQNHSGVEHTWHRVHGECCDNVSSFDQESSCRLLSKRRRYSPPSQ